MSARNHPDAPEAEYQSEWPDLGDGLGGIDVSIEREGGQPARIAVNITYDGEWTFALLDAETAAVSASRSANVHSPS